MGASSATTTITQHKHAYPVSPHAKPVSIAPTALPVMIIETELSITRQTIPMFLTISAPVCINTMIWAVKISVALATFHVLTAVAIRSTIASFAVQMRNEPSSLVKSALVMMDITIPIVPKHVRNVILVASPAGTISQLLASPAILLIL